MPTAVVHHPFHASPEFSEVTGPNLTNVGVVVPPMPPLVPRPRLPSVDEDELANFFDGNTKDDGNNDEDEVEDEDSDSDDDSDDMDDGGGDSDEEGPEHAFLTANDEDAEEEDDDGMDGEEEEEVSGDQGDAIVVPLRGSPPDWLHPQPPPNFEYTPTHDAPEENAIDNPGRWPLFSFAPRFDKKKNYIGHFTPLGAQVVPMDNGGTRSKNGWKFHYRGWKPDAFDTRTFVRDGATENNLKPLSRRGSLDAEVLKRHGLTAERVRCDPMFFFQMLFPLMSPSESGVENDHRMPYFSNVAMLTNLYASSMSTGIGIGHEWQPCSVKEIVKWTAIPIRHGALEGSPGTLKYRWAENDARLDSDIVNCMTEARWLAIKRYFKLNNNFEEGKRGTPSYNPCAKFDYIFRCLIHNMNYCTAIADLDQTIDESTWGFAGYSAEAGGRLMNKPVKKGKL